MILLSSHVVVVLILLQSSTCFAQKEKTDPENTVINIYPQSVQNYPDAESRGRARNLCEEIHHLEAQSKCRELVNRGIISQELLSAYEMHDARRFRHPGQGQQSQSVPSFINNGNSVHIEGGFHGSPPVQTFNRPGQDYTTPQQQVGPINPPVHTPQAPLVTFNLHSNPHFNEPTQNNSPINSAQNTNPQNLEGVNITEAILRINTKLLVNTTDIPNIVHALNQKKATENPLLTTLLTKGLISEQPTQQTPQTTEASTETTPAHSSQPTVRNTPLTQSAATTEIPVTTTEQNNLHYLIHSSPLTESQSIALLKGQTSAQQLIKGDAIPGSDAQPDTQNNVNIHVPSGSSVSTHQHQVDVADILTNLQILTILTNHGGKEEPVIQPSNATTQQVRISSKPLKSVQPQARSKSQIIPSLPDYANQYSFPTKPRKDSTIAYPENANSHPRISPVNTVTRITNKIATRDISNHNQKITYQNLLNILQQSDNSNYYNQLVGESIKAPNNIPIPTSEHSVEQMQLINGYNNILNHYNNRHQSQSGNAQPANLNDAENLVNYQDLILASILESQVLKRPAVAQPVISSNDPYIPAVHGSGFGVPQTLEPLPPAPPATGQPSLPESFTPNSAPFPVRAAGSSYSSIQDCLKNTACALILAGVVATGTTAALAIPVLTPLFGAGVFGKRRRREIRYFVLKPEDAIQFTDDYTKYANGTHISGLTEEVKCVYDAIMNPTAQRSQTMLHSLFKYITENKDKILNISVQEIQTKHQKPIPESFLKYLRSKKNEKNDLLEPSHENNGNNLDGPVYLELNTETAIDDITYDQNENEYDNLTLQEKLNYQQHDSEEITQELLNVDPKETEIMDINYSQTNPMDIRLHLNDPSLDIHIYEPTNHQATHRPHNILGTQEKFQHHTFHPSQVQRTSQRYPLHTFRPIPPPIFHQKRMTDSEHTRNPFSDTRKSFTASSDALFHQYNTQHNSQYGIQHSNLYPRTSKESTSDTLGNSQESQLLNILLNDKNQITESSSYPINTSNHSAIPQTTTLPVPSNQEHDLQKISKIVEFYRMLCHALNTPGIPPSTVIKFIAQRCLLLAHVGLTK